MNKPTSENKISPESGKLWWQPALMLFFRLSAWVVAPVIFAVFLGQWLDNKFNSSPWLFLTGVGAAFVISMIGLVTNTIREYKKIERDFKNDKKDEPAPDKSNRY